jgi:methyl-accepting chemotaxis protein
MANLRLPIDIGPITDGLRNISESLRSVRDSVALLPEVVKSLEDIREGVRTMADEVHRMRVGVDGLGEEVQGMRAAVEPLVPHMDVVAARIEALEPRLEDLSLALHPMRRLTRRRAANGDADTEDAAVEELDAEAAVADELAQMDSGENVSQSDGSPAE